MYISLASTTCKSIPEMHSFFFVIGRDRDQEAAAMATEILHAFLQIRSVVAASDYVSSQGYRSVTCSTDGCPASHHCLYC
jgi:hypothetical protein